LDPLDEGDYYIHQLLDCTVFTKSGERIGSVHDVLPIAENDLLVVKSGNREHLIPLTPTICFEIDLVKKTVTIDPPEGLLDLNEI
jgi:16S rRNA processing protein RimM